MIWTEEQIDTLIKLYPNTENKEIAEILKISLNSIKHQARKLGLYKTIEHRTNVVSKYNKKRGTDITHKLMFETAAKYKTRSEFSRLDGSIYYSTQRAGLLDDVCAHMIKGRYSIPQLILHFILKEIFKCDTTYND